MKSMIWSMESIWVVNNQHDMIYWMNMRYVYLILCGRVCVYVCCWIIHWAVVLIPRFHNFSRLLVHRTDWLKLKEGTRPHRTCILELFLYKSVIGPIARLCVNYGLLRLRLTKFYGLYKFSCLSKVWRMRWSVVSKIRCV